MKFHALGFSVPVICLLTVMTSVAEQRAIIRLVPSSQRPEIEFWSWDTEAGD